jgi:hypothetical protein
MANPEVATNPTLAKALPQIRQMFEDWANEFGVITPEAIVAIRKNGVNGIIQQLMPTADAKAQSRMAAQVLTALRPAIDDAIVKAGGKNWPAYLQSFEQGMSSIKGMELADRIRKLYAEGTPASKQQIIDLVRGESPEVIEDLFGSGRYQISKEMKMKDETLEVLIRAAQSGREFNRVLDVIPAKERSAFLAQFKNSESWNKFSVAVANAARAYAVSQAGEQPDVTVERIGNQLIQQPNVNAMRPQP